MSRGINEQLLEDIQEIIEKNDVSQRWRIMLKEQPDETIFRNIILWFGEGFKEDVIFDRKFGGWRNVNSWKIIDLRKYAFWKPFLWDEPSLDLQREYIQIKNEKFNPK